MALYKVTLAYDGARFAGFQRQQRGGRPVRTVQGELETALRSLGWQGEKTLSAGRTDSGVHASGQVVAFELDWAHPIAELQNALNARLPHDMAARAVVTAEPGFHPRYSALARRYRYRIYSQPVRDPLRDRFAWQVWPAVALTGLNQAAEIFAGEHDFAAFGAPPRKDGSTVRRINQAEWTAGAGELVFEITGNAFLYRMVRRLVFAQVVVCQGRLDLDDLRQKLAAGLPDMVQGLAPACGLELVEVMYS